LSKKIGCWHWGVQGLVTWAKKAQKPTYDVTHKYYIIGASATMSNK